MNCLWCEAELVPEVTWSTFIGPFEANVLCQICSERMERIGAIVCPRCNRPMEEMKPCYDCERWELSGTKLTMNKSLFLYNEFMQEVVAQWKYRGDYALIELFRADVEQIFRSMRTNWYDAILVPIPLSELRMKERGFNQAAVLAQATGLPVQDLLTRVHGEKQSKKTRHERMNTGNPFSIRGSVPPKVVLVDDIYTTGQTLQHAATLLHQNGSVEIASFTLIRG
ncbi:competence protein [Pontibacillus halophilus JSM 076056 = DSM 19796]|uniref:Competence protein n=1 Tax=Pontibacillus halophilus JSM 076056 = DSM 19796 TaxID=1385510 RepID=A0A0A5GS07_9BACI|nr:ComF family protein [Pontibacillus halophilus]KGX93945.1 competence protein [Pontibacillus halophilus JSM 076056 = DSM 19796]